MIRTEDRSAGATAEIEVSAVRVRLSLSPGHEPARSLATANTVAVKQGRFAARSSGATLLD